LLKLIERKLFQLRRIVNLRKQSPR
jgi:hypothetical protein